MSFDVVFQLYLESSHVAYFWVDDVLISGVLAQRIGIKHDDLTPRLALGENDIENWLNDGEVSVPPLFGQPNSDRHTIIALWNKTINYYRIKYGIKYASF